MDVAVHVGRAIHRRHRNPFGLPGDEKFLLFPGLGPLGHQRPQSVGKFATRETVFEDLLLGPFRVAHQLHQPCPLILFAKADENLAVQPRPDRLGTKGMVTQTRGHFTAIAVSGQRSFKHGCQAFLLGGFDCLAGSSSHR